MSLYLCWVIFVGKVIIANIKCYIISITRIFYSRVWPGMMQKQEKEHKYQHWCPNNDSLDSAYDDYTSPDSIILDFSLKRKIYPKSMLKPFLIFSNWYPRYHWKCLPQCNQHRPLITQFYHLIKRCRRHCRK